MVIENNRIGMISASRFNGYIQDVLEGHLPHVDNSGAGAVPQSTFICGRYGAGKSTFVDNYLGHPAYFPASYHMDSDVILKGLYEAGVISSLKDQSEFRACQQQMLQWFGALNVSFTYSFAGKPTLSPTQIKLPKTYEKTGDERYFGKQVGHMVLCDQDTSIQRVRGRQAEGGHPYKPLEGDFELYYRRKQAEIIYGLPSYMDGTDNYYIWDSSKNRKLSLVARIANDPEQGVSVTLHDHDAASYYGINAQNLGLITALYTQTPRGYAQLFSSIAHKDELADPQKAILFADPDRLNHVFVAAVVDPDYLKIAEHNIPDVECSAEAPVEFDPTVPQHYTPSP